MIRDSFWKNNPNLMMIRANELGRLVEHLDAEQRDGVWREGTSVAVPVLLSLAAEIGLEAWHRREGNESPLKLTIFWSCFIAWERTRGDALKTRCRKFQAPCRIGRSIRA